MRRAGLAVAFTSAAALAVGGFWALGVTDERMFLAQLCVAVPVMAVSSWLFLRETAREPAPAWRAPRRPGGVGDGDPMRWMARLMLITSAIALVPLVLSLAHVLLRSY